MITMHLVAHRHNELYPIDQSRLSRVGHAESAGLAIDEECTRRVGELDTTLLECATDGQVDLLLDIHVHGVIRRMDVVNHLEIKGAFPKRLEMRPVEPGLVDVLYDVLYDRGYQLQLVWRGLVDHPEAKRHTTLIHTLEIAYTAIEQVRVRKNQLLA